MKEEDFKEIAETILKPVGQTMFTMLLSLGSTAFEEQVLSTLIGNWLMKVNHRRKEHGKEETIEQTFNDYRTRLDVVLKVIKIQNNNPSATQIMVEEDHKGEGRRVDLKDFGN